MSNIKAIRSRNGRLISLSLLAVALCGSVLAGCDPAGHAPAVKEVVSTSDAQAKGKQAGGGVDDMSVVPAPTGVKTGIEGGKK